MSRTLVVYYSLSGHTREVAQAIAERCGADIEPIRERRARSGLRGLLRIAWEAATGRRVPLLPPEHDPGDYDLVVLGTPVWAGSVSTPVRTWLREHGERLQGVAFFCTEGGSGGERAFARMQALCGIAPAATLIVTEAELRAKGYARRLAAFADAVEPHARGHRDAGAA